MAYVRGNRADYDHWAALGNTGWDYASILPYFKKSEQHTQLNKVDPDYHGANGELNVTLPTRFKTPFVEAFVASCSAVGIPENKDYNGEKQEGAGLVHSTIKNGKRASAAAAFLKPVLGRNNLTALTQAQVTKIHFDGKKAVSVSYSKGGKNHTVQAHKEIILSAGAFQSPQLLMVSGIGDPQELSTHGIDCIHSLSGVGKNLQDHLFYPISNVAKEQLGINHYIPPFQQLKAAWNYFVHKKGVFCSGPLEGMAFLMWIKKEEAPISNSTSPPCGWVMITAMMLCYFGKSSLRWMALPYLPTLLHPKSRGTVSLASAHMSDAPVIQPNFLSEQQDVDRLIKGGKIALEVMEQAPIKEHKNPRATP